MAKLKNKVMQKKQNKFWEKKQKDNNGLKQEMQQLMQSKDYAKALEVMAEIAGTGQMDTETMYWGAKCYFLLGDYDRAAKWLDNTLSRQADYMSAKVLLSALCIAQKRYEDALKLGEYILAKGEEQMTEEDRAVLEKGLKYVAAIQKALFKDYPACRNFVGITDEAANALAKLRKLMDEVKQEGGLANVPSFDAAEEKADGAENGNEGEELPAEVAQPCKEDAADAFDTDKAVTEIMAKEVSLREKIRLLNAFAGGCYQAGDYQFAFELLSAALQLDAHDDAVLRNISYTCLAAGEKEQALEFAAKMTMVDFALLHAAMDS